MQHQNQANVLEANRETFCALLCAIAGPYRYGPTKFQQLLHEDWPAIRRIILGQETCVLLPSFVEIHVAEPCNLSCKFCRGELRNVPTQQAMIDSTLLLRTIDDIYELNPHAFVRFSGLIGEPLLHPRIHDAFERVNDNRLQWGLSTNGLLLDRVQIIEPLLSARYTHVSIDAGTDETYCTLKSGRPGDFEHVISNLRSLTTIRNKRHSSMQVVASFLLQSDNRSELALLSDILKRCHIDIFEIKMQHYDSRRTMTEEQVRDAYRIVAHVCERDQDEQFRIVVVQSEEEAMERITADSRRITFSQCYAGKLGLSATIDPHGNLQSCCQYYQRTLGVQGDMTAGLDAVWRSRQRQEILKHDPCKHCINCSPSDEFVNKFVDFMRNASRQDPSFLGWAESQIEKHRSINKPK